MSLNHKGKYIMFLLLAFILLSACSPCRHCNCTRYYTPLSQAEEMGIDTENNSIVTYEYRNGEPAFDAVVYEVCDK